MDGCERLASHSYSNCRDCGGRPEASRNGIVHTKDGQTRPTANTVKIVNEGDAKDVAVHLIVNKRYLAGISVYKRATRRKSQVTKKSDENVAE